MFRGPAGLKEEDARSLRWHRELILNYFPCRKSTSGVMGGLNFKAKSPEKSLRLLHLLGTRIGPLTRLASCLSESTEDCF